MSEWKKLFGTVAPWIGAAATGGVPALIGMAASQVGQAFGKDIQPTAEAIAQAVSGATTEQMLALKNADNEFGAKMQALGFQNVQTLEKIAAEDRANARQMHTAVRDLSTPIISYMVVVAFFLVVYLILTHSIEIPLAMRDVVMMMLGTLSAAFTQVLNFRFGTSASSRSKDDLIKGLQR
ncbi:hypothetical protein D3C78_1338030 [compost metagenome]